MTSSLTPSSPRLTLRGIAAGTPQAELKAPSEAPRNVHNGLRTAAQPMASASRGQPPRQAPCCFFCGNEKRDQDVVAPKSHLGLQSLMSTTRFLHTFISLSVCALVKVRVFKRAVTDLINYFNCFL